MKPRPASLPAWIARFAADGRSYTSGVIEHADGMDHWRWVATRTPHSSDYVRVNCVECPWFVRFVREDLFAEGEVP